MGRKLLSGLKIHMHCFVREGFPHGSVVKNPQMPETQVRSLGQEDSLEKEIPTHFSILAWRLPRSEEPDWLKSMGSQRI